MLDKTAPTTPLTGWRRCTMGGPALGALLLLLLAGRPSEGELCPQEGALRCPQLRERADAQLCCGACRLFSCCPAREAQLEGRRCPRETQTARPPIQDDPGKSVDWKPRVTFIILFIVFLLLWMAACYCKGCFWQRGTSYLHPSMPDYENQALFPLSSLPPPSPSFLSHPPSYDDEQPGFAASPPPYDDDVPTFLISPPFYDHESPGFLGPPPPYDPTPPPTIPFPPPPYSDDPPPYSVEDPLGNWDRPPPSSSPCLSSGSSSGEADMGLLVHRNVSRYSSTSTLETDA